MGPLPQKSPPAAARGSVALPSCVPAPFIKTTFLLRAGASLCSCVALIPCYVLWPCFQKSRVLRRWSWLGVQRSFRGRGRHTQNSSYLGRLSPVLTLGKAWFSCLPGKNAEAGARRTAWTACGGSMLEKKKQLVNEYMKPLALEMSPLNSSADQHERQLQARLAAGELALECAASQGVTGSYTD